MEATCHKATGCGWLSVRTGTGQGSRSRRVGDVSECTYLHGQRQHGHGSGQDRHSACTFVLREWPPCQPTQVEKPGQEVDGIAHCCSRRLRGYKGTLDEVSQDIRVECKDEKPGRPRSTLTYSHTRPYTCMQPTITAIPITHHSQTTPSSKPLTYYLPRSCHDTSCRAAEMHLEIG